MWIGIDIGTHSARAAYLGADGRPQLVRFADGSSALPALARQTMHGMLVGQEAARSLVGNQETTVSGCTRLMGRAAGVSPQLIERLPFGVRDLGGELYCNLLYAEVRAAEVYGQIVRALVDAAAAALGAAPEAVVLTVPAGAEDRFRVQARAAAESAGVRVARMISQPAAALLASDLPAPATVAVVSCGGGITEVSLVAREPEGVRVLAVVADPLLGGDDLAWRVAEQVNERLRASAGLDAFGADESRVAAYGLRSAVGEALPALARAREVPLAIDHGGGFGRDLVTVLRRSDTDRWMRAAYTQIAELCRRCMRSAGLGPQQVTQVLLIGDWAELPGLDEALGRCFGRPAAAIVRERAAELAALGAAAAGAAAAPLAWDVTPYPLGINCYYGETELLSPIIRANTPIPTPPLGHPQACTQQYSTRYPNQTSVQLDVLQYRGARQADPQGAEPVRPHECELLGSWSFSGLQPRPGQCASFSVTFAVDHDGVLQLVATETETGRTLHARVDRSVG